MKCSACGTSNPKNAKVCSSCAMPLRPLSRAERNQLRTPIQAMLHGLLWVVFALASVVVLALVIYRVYFWLDSYRVEHYYERNELMEPMIEETTLDNGLAAHAITFFGRDGDAVFVEELRQSFMISGGLTRVEIPDSQWFDVAPEEIEKAVVTLTPVLYTEDGRQETLPAMPIEIMTPQSPLTLVNPTKTYETVSTSIFPLILQVVPGSEVLVGTDNVTDYVNYLGELSVNLPVYAQGDNNFAILVSTPRHKQTRVDLDLYRAYQEINLEPNLTLDKKTNRQQFEVTGMIDPNALLTVDTPHVADSIKVKPNGNFSFLADLKTVGDNTITFRASSPGKQDSVISVNVYYVPTLNVYSRSAWIMDYPALKLYYDTWQGRVFLCEGVVTEVRVVDEEQTVIMDVGKDGLAQYVVLINYSSIGTPTVGQKYRAYADVIGNEFYANDYCPKLACRYMIPK
ncbi:MAG: hypothetical protein RSK76_09395 [Clostridia bacterium]